MTQSQPQDDELKADDLRTFLIAYRRQMLALAALIEKMYPETASKKQEKRAA